ncbi:hypothetical protein E8E13_001636 [Curvularia kusanoi]|uniref:Uncharacterized protein n=1 Tax=Curvularia kusanoi TaxID=90978 RepID=A0A9P4W3A2_CURKU|nr:hypothetical protein E8E13_001636 [Curvularia kusanoi]
MSKPSRTPPKNLRNAYIAPKPPYLRPIIICGVIMALSTSRSFISPGSPIYDYGLKHLSASGLKYAGWVQSGLFYFLFGAHAIETVMFTQRLQRHGVQAGSAAWWKWLATCFVGGQFCFTHFDREVGRFD